MSTYDCVLINDKGERNTLHYGVMEHKRVEVLTAARKIYFGRKGKVNFTDLVATCEGSTMRFIRRLSSAEIDRIVWGHAERAAQEANERYYRELYTKLYVALDGNKPVIIDENSSIVPAINEHIPRDKDRPSLAYWLRDRFVKLPLLKGLEV